MSRRAFRFAVGAVVLSCLAGAASGQALQREATKAAENAPKTDTTGPDAEMKSMSLLYVERPPLKEYKLNDKISIIINQNTRQTSQQKFDSKKASSINASVTEFPDLADLAQAELSTANGSPITGVNANATSNFKSDGKLLRTDVLTDRITATVIDVKPNGVLVLEARRQIKFNEDDQTVVLSGECRREDVTDANTVLSSQLADLKLVINREGQVSETGRKGFFTRLFDAIFNF